MPAGKAYGLRRPSLAGWETSAKKGRIAIPPIGGGRLDVGGAAVTAADLFEGERVRMRSNPRWWRRVITALFGPAKRGRRLPRSVRARRRKARLAAMGLAPAGPSRRSRRPTHERLAVQSLESRLALTGTPQMVLDINSNTVGSNPDDFVTIGSTVFFTATDVDSGTELWRSDGTKAGTVRVADINPGSAGSSPSHLTAIGSTLFFTASDGSSGTELWKSDGTTAGTVRVKDVNPGSGSSVASNLAAFGSNLFFFATDGSSAVRLWKSDGSEAGTVAVGSGSPLPSAPSSITAAGSSFFFTANDDAGHVQIWKTDATGVAIPLTSFLPGNSSWDASVYEPSSLTAVGASLFFTVYDDVAGWGLWRTDGTQAGTVKVQDFGVWDPFDPGSSRPSALTAIGSSLYYVANDASGFGRFVWRTDDSDTVRIEASGAGPSDYVGFTPFGSDVYYFDGGDLWKTNGWTASPIGSGIGIPQDLGGCWLGVVGTKLFVSVRNTPSTWMLWATDGAANGTSLIANGDGSSASANHFTAAGSSLFFVATGLTTGAELWKSDGTSAGTGLLKDINGATASSDPRQGVRIGSSLVFVANDGLSGNELWRSDGTASGTVRIKDILPGLGSSDPAELTVVGSTVYFTADDGASGRELWRTDGTEAGTYVVKDILPGAAASSPGYLTVVGSTLFFSANDGQTGYELWKSDGTAAGTVRVKDVRPGANSSQPTNLTAVGSAVFFAAHDGVAGMELWKSDGTDAGTVLVKDIKPGTGGSLPTNLTAVGATLYFGAYEGTAGLELWKSDGTAAGTVRVKDINPGASNSDPQWLTAVGSTLFFTAADPVNGSQVWRTDGTDAGTVRLTSLHDPFQLTTVGSTLLFWGRSDDTGWELWKSDGTSSGTVLVKDINPGVAGSVGSEIQWQPGNRLVVGSTLYFHADDGVHGAEIWKTDGTTAGTVRVTDVNPGTVGSYPSLLASDGSTLSFGANDGVHGRELWRLPLNSAPSGVMLANAVTALADNTSTQSRVKIADIAVADDGDGTNSITLSGADAASFAVDGTSLFLKAGVSLDANTKARFDVTVSVVDASVAGSAPVTAGFSLRVVPAVGTVGDFNYSIADGSAVIRGASWSLVDAVIPSSVYGYPVTTISTEAFASHGALRSVVIPSGVTSIGDNAFLNCANLESVSMPDSLTSIGMQAFILCRKLASVSLPASVTSVGGYAFAYCTSLSAFTVAEANSGFSSRDGLLLNKTGTTLWQVPGALTSVTVPSGVSVIREGAFGGCENVASVGLGEGVETIGDMAFAGCTSLRNLVLPASVRSIGVDLFKGSPNVASLTVSAANPSFSTDRGSLYDKGLTTLLVAPPGMTALVVPEGVRRIENFSAMRGAYSSLVLPSTVTSIGLSAFAACPNLTAVTIPAGVTTIEFGAFEQCWNLMSIKFLGSPPSWAPGIGGTRSTIVYYPSANAAWAAFAGGAFSGLQAVPYSDNAAPTGVTLANVVASLADTTNTQSRVKIADIVVTDDGQGTNTITLSGEDAASFEVDGTSLFLKAGVSLDAYRKKSFAVTVDVVDRTVVGGGSVSTSVVVPVVKFLQPVAYSIANGDTGSYHYWDESFNGTGNTQLDDASLAGGLGQLTDGVVGGDVWSADFGHGPAYEWVGWVDSNPVLTFDLGALKHVDGVLIHANNQQSGGVSLFASASVSYSTDGVTWSQPTTAVTSDADRADPTARFIDVGGAGSGRYVRITLERQSEWVFVSDVRFRAAAAVVWDGGDEGTGTRFLDSANWVGGVLPQTGDTVIIGGNTSMTPVVIDGDVSGVTIRTSRSLSLPSGNVSNSRIELEGGATIRGGGFNTWETGWLENVSLAGVLDLSSASWSALNIRGTLTLDGGTVVLGNRFGTTLNRLLMHGTTSIDGTGSVIFGSSWQNAIVAMGSVAADSGQPITDTFTIGAGVTLHGNAGWIGDDQSWPVARIVNHGRVLGDAAPEPGGLPYGDFATSGELGNNDNGWATVDRTAVSDPLPEASYRSIRWNNPSFALPGLVPGATYTVRLHFAELWKEQRRENVFINGVKVLVDFGIAEAAGGTWKAVTRSFQATADASGRIVVSVQGTNDEGQISAIEVFDGATRVLLSDCGLVPGTVTLAASRSIENAGTLGAASGGTLVVHGALSSSGTVKVSSGSTLSLTGAITNTGTIQVASGATLTITGNVSSSGLGAVVSSGSVVVQGTIDNAGQTLTLDGTTGSWRMVAGSRIVGGRIRLRDGATLVGSGWNTQETGWLEDVTLSGVLDPSATSWTALNVQGTLTLDGGTIVLGNHFGTTLNRLLMHGTTSIDGTGSVVFGSNWQSAVVAMGSVSADSGQPITDTFTIGAGVTLHGNAGWIGDDQSWPVARIVNHGRVLGDAAPEPGGLPYGDFATSGELGNNDNGWATVDRTAVSDPLPEASYRSIRWNSPSFMLPGLVPGATYTARLHFAELWNDQRRENVFINGVKVLDDFSIVEAAGGTWKAVTRSFTATADALGRIVVSVQGTSDNGQISAIEIFDGATRVLLSDCGLAPGTVTFAASRSIENSGTLGAAGAAAISVVGTLTSSGTIRSEFGSRVRLGPTSSGGTVLAGGDIGVSGDLIVSGGQLKLAGGVVEVTGVLTLGGGVLSGSGTVKGAVTSSATIAPGSALAAGSIAVVGSLSLVAGSRTEIDVFASGGLPGGGGNDFAPGGPAGSAGATDRITVTGAATLGGTLAVHVPAGWVPPQSSPAVTVMSYASKTGTFAGREGAIAGVPTILTPSFGPTTLSLEPVRPLDAGLTTVGPFLVSVAKADGTVTLLGTGDSAALPLNVSAGKVVTIVATPAAGSRIRVDLVDVDGVTVLASASSAEGGGAAVLQTVAIATAGTHWVRVTSLDGAGAVSLGLLFHAAANPPAPSTSTNLLVNGSFESGAYGGGGFTRVGPGSNAITGWVVGGSGLDWHAITGDAAHFGRTTPDTGTLAVDLSLDGGDAHGTIAQTFATVPGERYRVSFLLGAPWFDAGVRVSAGDTVKTFTLGAESQYGFAWARQSFDFVATATSSTLLFEGLQGGWWAPVIDDVSVVPTTVPIDGSALTVSPTADRLAALGRGSVSTNVVAGKTVTAVAGSFNGDPLSTIVDGTSFERGRYWQAGTVWWTGETPTLEIDLGGSFLLDRASLQADNNDSYVLQYRDPATGAWHDWWEVPNYWFKGIGGMIQRPDTGVTETADAVVLRQVVADKLRLRATGGDGYYSVSELKVYGAPVATVVPDGYSFAAVAGQPVSLVLASTSGAVLSAARLELFDAAGDRLAIGSASLAIDGRAIVGFVPPADGRYTVRVSNVVGEYGVAVYRGATLGLDGDHAVSSRVGTTTVVGALGADAPRLLSSMDLDDSWGVKLSADGRYAYVTDGLNGLAVFDVSDSRAPVRIGGCATDEWCRDIALSPDGRHAYVTQGYSGVLIVDISDPKAPRAVGRFDTSGYAQRSTPSADGQTLFVADDQRGLVIIDVRSPAEPTLVGSIDTPGYAAGVTVSADGRVAYVSDWSGGVQIVDVTDRTQPRIVGAYQTPGAAAQARLSADGRLLFVADNDRGLLVLDVTTPSLPTLVGSYDTPSYSYGVTLSPDGSVAFVADAGSGLQIIDVSNPSSPQIIAAYDTTGAAIDVQLSQDGDLAYVADYTSGLAVFDVARRSQAQHRFAAKVGDTLSIVVSVVDAARSGLDPAFDVVDPSGVVVASGTQLSPVAFIAAVTGEYVVRVRGGGVSGGYLLTCTGSTATPAAAPFGPVSTVPASGSIRATFPGTYRVTFDRDLLLSAVSPADLTVNGVAASAVTVVDGRTVEFTIAGAADGERRYDVAIAAGALTSLDGTPSGAFTSTFTLDASAAAPVVSLANDTGSSATDRITKDGTLSLSGVESGATVEYSVDAGVTWGKVFVAIEGANSVLVRQTDAAGNVSKAGSLGFTVDTRAPLARSVTLADDTGSDATDRVTSSAVLAFATTLAIPTVYATGVDDRGVPLPNGSADSHYALVSVPGGTSSVRVATNANGYPIGSWIGDDGLSAWIGPASDDALNGPGGQYVYRTTFDLTGFSAATAALGVRWSTDNDGVDVLLNGRSLGVTTSFDQWAYGLVSFSVTSGFVDGINSLEFVVNNGGGPTGLRVEMAGTADVASIESGATAEYSYDGGVTWSSTYAPVEGANSLLVRQVDVAGNVSNVLSLPFTLDTSAAAPVVTLAYDTGASATDGVTKDGTLSLTGVEVGATVEYSIDGGSTWAKVFTATEGSNSVLVRQTDVAGNVSKAGSLAFTLDTKAPAAPVVSLKNDTGSSATDGITKDGTLALSGFEAGAAVEYSVDGGSTWGKAFAAAEGKNTVQVRQIDTAGNASPATSLVFTVDTKAPAAPSAKLASDTGVSATDLRTSDGTLAWTGVESGATAQFSVDGGTTWSAAAGIAEGSYPAVHVRQTDAAGNVSATAQALGAVVVKKSVAKPGVTLKNDTGSSGTDRVTSDATLVLTGIESKASVEYSIDNTSWTNVFKAKEGANALWVRQKDDVGNVAASDRIDFTLDTSALAPTAWLAVDSGASDRDGITNVPTIATKGVESGATFEYSLGGGAWTASLVPVTGGNSVTVRQRDLAGNVSAASSAVAFTFDGRGASVTGRSLGLEVTQGLDRLDITFSEALGGLTAADVSIVGPSGPVAVGTPRLISGTTWRVPFTPLPDVGDYTVSILSTARDVAGNALDQNGDGVGGDAYVTTLRVGQPDGPPAVTMARTGLRVTGSFVDPGAGQTWTATFDPGDGAGPRALSLAADKTFAFDLASARFADIVVRVTDSNGNVGTATLARAVSVLLAGSSVTVTGGEFDDTVVLSADADGNLAHNLPLGGNLTSAIDIDSATPGEQRIAVGAFSSVTVLGGAGDDRLDASGLPRGVTLVGGAGDDTIVGSAGDDSIDGGDGNDTITAGAGDDTIDAGAGVNKIAAGTGNDRVMVAGTPAADAFAVVSLGNSSFAYSINGVTSSFSGVDSVKFVSRGGDDVIGIAPGLPFPVVVSGISPVVQMHREGDRLVGRVVGLFSDPGDLQTWTGTIDPGDGLGARTLPLAADDTFDYPLPDRPVTDIVVAVTDDEGNSGSATIGVTGVNRFLPTGSGLWSDAANWSAGHVPLAGGDELAWIPAGRTVRVAGDTTIGPLRCRGTLDIQSGTANFVSDTIVAGTFRAAPGVTVRAGAAGASLVTSGTTTIDGAAFLATAGGVLSIGGVTACDAGTSALAWSADGVGSSLSFPDLVTLQGVHDAAGIKAIAIRSTAGAGVSLPVLATIAGGGAALTADGVGSRLAAGALSAWSASAAGGTLGSTGSGLVTFGAATPTLTNVTITVAPDSAYAAGAIALGSGSLLTGTGTVPSIVNRAGIVRPAGDAIGSLRVAGDFAQAAGGVLEVDVDTLLIHDGLTIDGRASIGGTVRLLHAEDSPQVAIGDSIECVAFAAHDGTLPEASDTSLTFPRVGGGSLVARPILTGTGLAFCFPIVVTLSSNSTETASSLSSAVEQAATIGGTVAIALDTSNLGSNQIALDALPTVSGSNTNVVFAGSGDLTITGNGGSALEVTDGASATISGVTLSGFGTDGSGALTNAGTLSLVNCTIETGDSSAPTITNTGTVVAANSTIAAIENSGSGGATVSLSGCTVGSVTSTVPDATIDISGGTVDTLVTDAAAAAPPPAPSPEPAPPSAPTKVVAFGRVFAAVGSGSGGITGAGGLTSSTKIVLSKATLGTIQTRIPTEVAVGPDSVVTSLVNAMSAAGGFTGTTKIVLSKATLSSGITTNAPIDVTLGEGSVVSEIRNTIDAAVASAGGFTGSTKIVLSKATLSSGITTNVPIDVTLGEGSVVSGIRNTIDAAVSSAGGFTGSTKIVLSKATLSSGITTNVPIDVTLGEGSVVSGIRNTIDATVASAGGFTGTTKIVLSKATLSGGFSTNVPAEITVGEGSDVGGGILNAIDAAVASAGGFTGTTKIVLSKATLSGGITTTAPASITLGDDSRIDSIANAISSAGGFTGTTKIVLSKATLSGGITTNAPADIEVGGGSALTGIVYGVSQAVAQAAGAAGGFTGTTKIVLSKATLSGGIATNVPVDITLGEDASVAGDILSQIDSKVASAGGFTGTTKIVLSKATLGGTIVAQAPTDIEAGGGATLGGIVNDISSAGGFTGTTKIVLSKATLSGRIWTGAPADIALGEGSVVAGDVVNAVASAGGFTGTTKIVLSKATLGGSVWSTAPADIQVGDESVMTSIVNAIDSAGGFTGTTKIVLSKATLSGGIQTNAPADIEVGDDARLASIVYGVDAAVAAAAKSAGGFTGTTKIVLSKATLSGGIATNVPVDITLGEAASVAGDIVNVIDKAVASAGGLTGTTKIVLSKATLAGVVATNAPADIEALDGATLAGVLNAIDGAGGFTGTTKIVLSKATLTDTLRNLAPADISIGDGSTVKNLYHEVASAGGFTGTTKIVLSKATLSGTLVTRSAADVEIGADSVVAGIVNAFSAAGGFTGTTKIVLSKATLSGTLASLSPADISIGDGSTVANVYSDLSSAGGLTTSTKIVISKATLSGALVNKDPADITLGEGATVANLQNLPGAAGGLTGTTKIVLSKATLTGQLYNSASAAITIGAGSTVKNVLNTVEGGVFPASAPSIAVDGGTVTGVFQNEAPASVTIDAGAVIGDLLNRGDVTSGWTPSTIAVIGAKVLRTFVNSVAAAVVLDGATFAGLVTSGIGAAMTIDVTASTFAYLLNTGSAVGRIRVSGSTFQSIQNDGDDVAEITVAGGAGAETLVNNGNRVVLSFTGGGGDDVFVNDGQGDAVHGQAVRATVALGDGRDRAVLGGTYVAGSSVDGGAGDDTTTFVGSVTGSLALVEGANADSDTLDFSPLSASGGGITVDLALTSPQTVRAGLSLALSTATGFENVVGTSLADVIRGNARSNRLSGADLVDDRQAAGAAWNGRTQVVYLDFDTETNTASDTKAERVYTSSDREAVRAAVQAAYTGFPVSVVTTRPAAGEFVTVFFNLTRDDGEPGGDSSEIDFGNRSLGGTARVQVNGLLGLAGTPADTTANWVNASAWIAAHEVGHLMGLRHADAFGPPGYGVHAPPGGQGKSVSDVFAGNFIEPGYTGPSAAFETNDHMMATAALTGFTTWDAVDATFFGERESVKLAYAAAAPTTADGRLLVAEQTAAHGSLTLAGSQVLQPVSIDVPNNLQTGLNAGKGLFSAAVNVLGRVAALGEKDVYRIDGRTGDLWNMQVMSTALKRLGSDTFDATLRIYDASGSLLVVSDDESESQDPSVIDFTLPADGTYYLEVSAYDDPAIATDGTGGSYELFAWRFDTANRTDGNDVLEGRAGDDLLEGGAGDDTYVFAGTGLGSDVVREDARLVRSAVGNGVATDGRDAHDKLDFSSYGATVTIDLSSTAVQAVGGGNLSLRLSSARDLAGEPAVAAGIEDVVGNATLANAFTVNARSNTFVGGTGDDIFRFTAVAKPATAVDSVTAGAGVDTLDFTGFATGITLDLAGSGKNQSLSGKNSLRLEQVDVESLVGTAFRDVIAGNPLDNTFWGMAGNDQLSGGIGSDILLGGTGDDLLNGGVGNDLLVGGAGADTLQAGGGNDILIGGEFKGDHGGTSWTSIVLLRQILSDWGGSTRKFDLDLSTASDDVADAATAAEKDTFTVGVGATWVVMASNDVISDAANFVETVSNNVALTSPGDKKSLV